MVRSFHHIHKKASFNIKKMFHSSGRHQPNSPVAEPGGGGGGSSPLQATSPSATTTTTTSASDPTSEPSTQQESAKKPSGPSDMQLMKERFAKLLLGEDMSGGGKGVSSALALSNAITNLAASVFGEQRKLEPMNPERRARWRKECDWLLSVTDHVVELVPSQQEGPNGAVFEVMATKQRADLLVNVPALRKLDTMLIDCLDNFRGQNEFWYVKNTEDSETNNNRNWWIPTVKVPANGLSEITRKWIQHQKESVNQVLKAALAINAQVLSEMEIPESYIESLPKNGRASLGDSIYKSITDEFFDPEQFLSNMDLSSEHKVVDLKNRIEASIVIWRRKMVQKDSKSTWGSAISLEKRELFEERAETILLILKHQFPGIPQSTLDINKIQFNRDVGHAVLESYSRVLESLASAVMSRIDDVLYADATARNSQQHQPAKKLSAASIKMVNPDEAQGSMTLLDFMGWSLDQGDDKKGDENDEFDDYNAEDDEGMSKMQQQESKKLSYLERLENWGGIRSPTARH